MTTPIEPATPEPLAEQPHPDDDREQRRRPARDRVDDRQVAAPVRRGQQDEIGRLDEPGRDAERDALGGRAGRAPCAHHTPTPSGTMATRRREQPDRRGPQRVARRLEPDVPGEMEQGRHGDEADDERGHARDVTCRCRAA